MAWQTTTNVHDIMTSSAHSPRSMDAMQRSHRTHRTQRSAIFPTLVASISRVLGHFPCINVGQFMCGSITCSLQTNQYEQTHLGRGASAWVCAAANRERCEFSFWNEAKMATARAWSSWRAGGTRTRGGRAAGRRGEPGAERRIARLGHCTFASFCSFCSIPTHVLGSFQSVIG